MQATAEREEERREKENPLVRRRPETVRQQPHARRSRQEISARHSRVRRRDLSRQSRKKEAVRYRPETVRQRPHARHSRRETSVLRRTEDPVTAETAATTEMRPRTEVRVPVSAQSAFHRTVRLVRAREDPRADRAARTTEEAVLVREDPRAVRKEEAKAEITVETEEATAVSADRTARDSVRDSASRPQTQPLHRR